DFHLLTCARARAYFVQKVCGEIARKTWPRLKSTASLEQYVGRNSCIAKVIEREGMSKWLGAMLLTMMIALAAQADDLGALDQRFRTLYSQGKYSEAATVGEHVLKITEQTRGPSDVAAASALHNLATVYHAQGRYE